MLGVWTLGTLAVDACAVGACVVAGEALGGVCCTVVPQLVRSVTVMTMSAGRRLRCDRVPEVGNLVPIVDSSGGGVRGRFLLRIGMASGEVGDGAEAGTFLGPSATGVRSG